jgi:protease-4
MNNMNKAMPRTNFAHRRTLSPPKFIPILWALLAVVALGLGSPRSSSAQEQPATEQKSTEQSTATESKEGEAKKAAEEASAEQSDAEKADATKSEAAEPATESTKTSTRAVKQNAPPKKQLRWLALSGSYSDLAQPPSLDPTALLLGGLPEKSKSFYRLCDYLDEVAEEENVTHLLFDLSDPSLALNPAQLDEFSRRLTAFKQKGKRTIAWLENADNVHLAIAVQCDDIIMADFGGIDMPSSSMETTFYRDAMDLVGIKASVVRAGDFKGAVEPYLNPQMSSHLKEHYLRMLESINSAQVSRIAKGRGLTTAAVRDLQKKRMLLPSEALSTGLVTKLAPYGSMKKTITEMVGADIEWTKPKAKPKREKSFFELMGSIMAGPKESTMKYKEDSIVVLHLQGAIVDGKENSPGSIVAGPTVKQIEELINEDKVKGVVVRINSPGGSATASEAIRQALLELSKKKPVVFSMGEVAASGGYWVTCIGQPIYAERATITGSIGVFSLKISIGSLLRRVGVHVETVALDDSAALNSIDQSWSDEDISNMQRFIDDVYSKFLTYASESRKMPLDKLRSLAGGRVWSGEQAKLAGLVDELGGVDDCINAISKRAGLSKYKVVHRPDPASSGGLFSLFSDDDSNEVTHRVLADAEAKWLQTLGKLGFKLTGLRALLKSSLDNQSGAPKAWALMTDEFKIR